MPGTLYVVATPIGNLEDVTFRALRTLREVDLIAAEDTRRTAKLLAHYEIRRPVTALHEHNEVRETPKLIARLNSGESIALVSDAGTPGISDPGARMVHAAHEARIKVVPIPGASAVATALSASGFPASQFVFLGYLPRSGTARAEALERLSKDGRVAVIFEAPHRIHRTLADLKVALVDRPISVLRELTKHYEELVISQNIPTDTTAQGEFTIVVGPEAAVSTEQTIDDALVAVVIDYLTNKKSIAKDDAMETAAKLFHVAERDVKKAWKRTRGYGG